MKHRVERFYADIWNRQDFAVADEILAADFRFRGSLGSESSGIPVFLTYVQSVHAALADYRCIIDELIVDGGACGRAHDLCRRPSRAAVWGACNQEAGCLGGCRFFPDHGKPDRLALGIGGC
jgi:hypothetical protein